MGTLPLSRSTTKNIAMHYGSHATGLAGIQHALYLGSKALWPTPEGVALGDSVRIGSWLTYPEVLEAAWKALKKSGGRETPGVDGQSFSHASEDPESWVNDVVSGLRSRKYQPRRLRRVSIPKTSGGTRTISVPTLQDRFVQYLLLQFLGPVADGVLPLTSFACRPEFGPHVCLKAVSTSLECAPEGELWIVRADVEGFYDNVRHDLVQRILRQHLRGAAFFSPLNKQLSAWGVGRGVGLPQGAAASATLANLALGSVDYYFSCLRRGVDYVRYADDFLIAVRGTRADAERVLQELKEKLALLKLRLNNKTQLASAEEGAEFLGFHVRRTERGAAKLGVTAQTLQRLRDRIERDTFPGEEPDWTSFEASTAYYRPFAPDAVAELEEMLERRTGQKAPCRRRRINPRTRNSWRSPTGIKQNSYPPSTRAASGCRVGEMEKPPEVAPHLAYATRPNLLLQADFPSLSNSMLGEVARSMGISREYLGQELERVQHQVYQHRMRRTQMREHAQHVLRELGDTNTNSVDKVLDRSPTYVAELTSEKKASELARTLEKRVAETNVALNQATAEMKRRAVARGIVVQPGMLLEVRVPPGVNRMGSSTITQWLPAVPNNTK